MSETMIVILDILVVVGLCVSAVLASTLKKRLSAVIALSVTGIFAAAAFWVMHAPDEYHEYYRLLCLPFPRS